MRTVVMGVLTAVLTFVSSISAFGGDAKLTVEELLAKHQAAVGTPEARAAAKSRLMRGEVVFRERLSNAMHVSGSMLWVSSGRQQKTQYQFSSPQYRGETFILDEKGSIQIDEISPGRRSMLGNFLNDEKQLLTEGLWGGTMNALWPLLDPKVPNRSFKYRGLKKVQNEQLHDLEYASHSGHSEFKIHLFFEPETLRHVLSVYTLTVPNSAMRDITKKESVATDVPARTTVEERFSDFKVVNGLTLPSHWDVRWRTEPATNPAEYQWETSLMEIQNSPEALTPAGGR